MPRLLQHSFSSATNFKWSIFYSGFDSSWIYYNRPFFSSTRFRSFCSWIQFFAGSVSIFRSCCRSFCRSSSSVFWFLVKFFHFLISFSQFCPFSSLIRLVILFSLLSLGLRVLALPFPLLFFSLLHISSLLSHFSLIFLSSIALLVFHLLHSPPPLLHRNFISHNFKCPCWFTVIVINNLIILPPEINAQHSQHFKY